MKRFLLDAFVVLLIVYLARFYNNKQMIETVDDKLARFNQQVEKHEVLSTTSNIYPLNQVEENFAGKLGDSMSSIFIGFIDGSVRLVNAVFSESDF